MFSLKHHSMQAYISGYFIDLCAHLDIKKKQSPTQFYQVKLLTMRHIVI